MKEIVEQDIGEVALKIDDLLEKYACSSSRFAREVKMQYRQAKKYKENAMQKVNLEILARICYTFHCEISDILEYIPPR